MEKGVVNLGHSVSTPFINERQVPRDVRHVLDLLFLLITIALQLVLERISSARESKAHNFFHIIHLDN